LPGNRKAARICAENAILGSARERGASDEMNRCKVAEKIAKIVDKEADKAEFTCYYNDFANAYAKYVTHI